jgi:hypothetical protein
LTVWYRYPDSDRNQQEGEGYIRPHGKQGKSEDQPDSLSFDHRTVTYSICEPSSQELSHYPADNRIVRARFRSLRLLVHSDPIKRYKGIERKKMMERQITPPVRRKRDTIPSGREEIFDIV